MAEKNIFKKKAPKRFKDVGKMDKDEARDKVENLREAIEYHNYLYYVRNKPKISDNAYDRLFERLQKLEKAFPDLQSADSPTRPTQKPALKSLTRPKIFLNGPK